MTQIVFEPTGERRSPKRGEWFLNEAGQLLLAQCDFKDTPSASVQFPIYRQIAANPPGTLTLIPAGQRAPKIGEWYRGTGSTCPIWKAGIDHAEGAVFQIYHEQGEEPVQTKEPSPPAVVAYEPTCEFRLPKKGEFYYDQADGGVVERAINDFERVQAYILRKVDTDRVTVAPQASPPRQIYDFVYTGEVRPARKGELYESGGVIYCAGRDFTSAVMPIYRRLLRAV